MCIQKKGNSKIYPIRKLKLQATNPKSAFCYCVQVCRAQSWRFRRWLLGGRGTKGNRAEACKVGRPRRQGSRGGRGLKGQVLGAVRRIRPRAWEVFRCEGLLGEGLKPRTRRVGGKPRGFRRVLGRLGRRPRGLAVGQAEKGEERGEGREQKGLMSRVQNTSQAVRSMTLKVPKTWANKAKKETST